jgi:hypothetical protein
MITMKEAWQSPKLYKCWDLLEPVRTGLGTIIGARHCYFMRQNSSKMVGSIESIANDSTCEISNSRIGLETMMQRCSK